MLLAKADTEQEAGQAFEYIMAKAREMLPPGRVRKVLDD